MAPPTTSEKELIAMMANTVDAPVTAKGFATAY
jgi:hypothetical protein